MRKLTTVALVGAMALTSFAFADSSRENSFGEGGVFTDDVVNSFTLPTTVAENPNALYLELGGGFDSVGNDAFNNVPGASPNSSIKGQAWGGVDKKMGPGVLSIWGNRPFTVDSGAFFGTNAFSAFTLTVPTANGGGGTPSTGFLTPQQQIDLIYGWELSDTTTIGIGLNRAVNDLRTEVDNNPGATTVVERSSSNYGLSLGGEMKDLGPLSFLNIGVQYNMLGDTNTNNNGTINNQITKNGSEIDVRIAGEMKGDKGSFQNFQAILNMDGLDFKSVPGQAAPANSYMEAKESSLGWLLGWAMGMSGEKGMGLGGLVLKGLSGDLDEGYSNVTNKQDSSNLALDYVAALEAKPKDWVTTRAGFATTLYNSGSTTVDTGAVKTINSNSGAPKTTISLGLGLSLGDFVLDGSLNQDLLYNGPFLLNGVPTQLFSQVSLTYAWGEAKE